MQIGLPQPPKASLGAAPASREPNSREPNGREKALRRAAEELEANFLAEMLKNAGIGKPRLSLGGGIGEEQFSSLLVTEQARAMVKAGGIGLAQQLYETLKARETDGN